MDYDDEDRLSISYSDDEDDKDSARENEGEKKRSWHQSENRPLGHQVDPADSESISPSPNKRFKEYESDGSYESPKHDQEEGEILSDDSSVEVGKSGEGGDVATRDHSPPDSYNITSEKESPQPAIRVNPIEVADASPKEQKMEESDDIEVSIIHDNHDDSLFDFGSKDTEDMKDSAQSPVYDREITTTSFQRQEHSSSESESTDSSTQDEDVVREDKEEMEGVKEADADLDREARPVDSDDADSDSSNEQSGKPAQDFRDSSKERGTDMEHLFKQREHPTSTNFPAEVVSTSAGLFKQRKLKEKDDFDGKQMRGDSDEEMSDPSNVDDHLVITVPQRTISKERRVKVHRKTERSREEGSQLVEDISDEDVRYESVYANEKVSKAQVENQYRQEQQRSKSSSSPSDSSKGRDKKYLMQDNKGVRRKEERERPPRQEQEEMHGSKKRFRSGEPGVEKWRKGTRIGGEREYEKKRSYHEYEARGSFDEPYDPTADRRRSRDEHDAERSGDKSRIKSTFHVKSQVHVYSDGSRPKVESSDLDLRKKLLKKHEAKNYDERLMQKGGEQSKVYRGEQRVEGKGDPRPKDIIHSKDKLSKRYQKEHKAKKRSKHKEEKDSKKLKHAGNKTKVGKKEHKKKKEAKSEERAKRKAEKGKEEIVKVKERERNVETSSDSESSGSESHHSSDGKENEDQLNDNMAVDEDILLRKSGSDSGQEQGYDDISSAESELSPVPSPVELKKPPYYPATQGCRSVEEFEWLNRIEEGTYGVVYRARDRRTDEIVALKRLKMEKEREGFPITSLREINTLLKAQHPNIVTVREIVVGSNMDKIYIVMDYVAHDLKSLMEVMTQPFLAGEVKTLMIQLLRGVQHLHDNWILHRDIKTSNLLLSHNGILKIGDFGLAREYGSPLKLYTPIVVTLWYRAPELLLGMKEYSTAIDVWSVGCVFAELLMMKPLFPGKSEIDQLNRIFKELGTPNDKIWPGPPPFSELPMVKKTSFADHPYNVLRQRFGATLTDKGFNLLNRFLTYDPKKRITSDEALKHEYFEESPLPVDPSMFPTWPAKSEGHKVARKHNASPKPPEGGQYAQQMADDETNLFGFHMPAAVKGVASKGPGFSLKF